MTINLDEILEHQDRLRREIMERECLLAAFDVLRGYMNQGRVPKSVELGPLVSLLASRAPIMALPAEAAAPTPAPAALPAPAPEPRYVHPELKALGNRYGSNTRFVTWAIDRMTGDYTLRDIGALLAREGVLLTSAEISVVLTRLKRQGVVNEIRWGSGRTPAIFRQPGTAADAVSTEQPAAAAVTA